MRSGAGEMQLCSVRVAGQVFGIPLCCLVEVLGPRRIYPVPLAPADVAGVVVNRGEVLTTLCLRTQLGLPRSAGESCLLVVERLAQDQEAEQFWLLVDAVGTLLPWTDEPLHPAKGCTNGLLVKLAPQQFYATRKSLKQDGAAE